MNIRLISSGLLAAAALTAQAEVTFPSVVSDNMVLQQQTDARIWGKAKAGSKVKVVTSWDGKKHPYTVTADRDGRWQVKLNTPAATAEPQTITVTDPDGSKTLSNVLIGEVWYCSGQSNMEMPVRGFHRQPVDGSLDVILEADSLRPIRMFTVKKNVSATPLDDCEGQWDLNNPEGVANCSAAGYFFADHLNKQLNVPVGLVIADWGGTRVQPWMSRESVEPLGLVDTSHLDGTVDMKTKGVHGMASVMYNAMVAPITPYSFKGMLWYQGESNSSDPELYDKLMPVFVTDMRKKFDRGDIPFYYVQIAPYAGYGGKEKVGVPKLRLVQARLMKQVPNAGMVVTMDIGTEHNIHPTNKKEVGKRLAYWALAKDYGKNNYAWSGPVYNHMEVEGDKAYLYFDNTGGGVCPLEEWLDGFEVAGEDGVYYPAEAKVEGPRGLLGVRSDKVAVPKKVRYGFRTYFKGTLFDNFGLPASPFITSGELE